MRSVTRQSNAFSHGENAQASLEPGSCFEETCACSQSEPEASPSSSSWLSQMTNRMIVGSLALMAGAMSFYWTPNVATLAFIVLMNKV